MSYTLAAKDPPKNATKTQNDCTRIQKYPLKEDKVFTRSQEMTTKSQNDGGNISCSSIYEKRVSIIQHIDC